MRPADKKYTETVLSITYWMQMLINNYDAEVYIKDLDGKYLMADETFCQQLDKMHFEVIGKTDYEYKLFCPNDKIYLLSINDQ